MRLWAGSGSVHVEGPELDWEFERTIFETELNCEENAHTKLNQK